MSAAVPNNSTGDIVVTLSGPVGFCIIGVWITYNTVNSSPFATVIETGSTSGTRSNTLNIPSNGFVFIVSNWQGATSGAVTASGVTFIEDAEFTIADSGTDRFVFARIDYPTVAATAKSITATGGAGASDCDFAGTSWS